MKKINPGSRTKLPGFISFRCSLCDRSALYFYSHFEAHCLSSSTEALALKRSSAAVFTPLARSAMFSPDEPMPLEPDVAKGIMVFPEKSYSSANVSIMEGSLYHHTGKPMKTAS